MEILVTSPDDGIFMLFFMSPVDGSFIKSGQITSGCSADEMQAAIKGFYTSVYKKAPLVTLTYRDSYGNDVDISNSTLTFYVYTVQVPTALTSASVTNIMLVPLTSWSNVQFRYPDEVQLSSPPLSG